MKNSLKQEAPKHEIRNLERVDLNDEFMSGNSEPLLLKLNGIGAEEHGIFDGDKIMIDRAIKYAPDALAVVYLNGGYFIRKSARQLMLVAKNGEPVNAEESGEVVGIIKWIFRKVGR